MSGSGPTAAKFETSADTLLRFAKGIDGEVDCDAVTRTQVLDYLAGNGPMTRYRENKYCALAGFYPLCDQPGLRQFLAAARQ